MFVEYALLRYSGLLPGSRRSDRERERFAASTSSADGDRWMRRVGAVAVALAAVMLGIGLILGVLAAYLSWASNAVLGYGVPAKLFFSIFAFLFNTWYLFSHLLHKMDMLSHIRRLSGPAAPAPAAAPPSLSATSVASSSSPAAASSSGPPVAPAPAQ